MYITEAVVVEPKIPITPVTQQVGNIAPKVGNNPTPKQVVAQKTTPKVGNEDKMSKEEWAKKDEGIKFLACLKASAVFNAHRENADIRTVITNARDMFDYDYSSRVVENKKEETEDVFEENGI